MSRKPQFILVAGHKVWVRICPTCNKEVHHKNRFSWYTSRKNRTVCYSCTNRGENNPFYRKSHTQAHKDQLSKNQINGRAYVHKSLPADPRGFRICKNCDNKFKTSDANKTSLSKRFCSIQCFNAFTFVNGYAYTSLPEARLATILDSLDVRYVHQFQVGQKFFDFFLPEYNILIEVDGIYWHSRDAEYETLPEWKKSIKDNDAFKDELAKKSGYKLVRLWEDEVEDVSKYIR